MTTRILGGLLASTAPSAPTLNGPTWVLCRLNVPEAFGEGGCGKATRWRIIVAFGENVCVRKWPELHLPPYWKSALDNSEAF